MRKRRRRNPRVSWRLRKVGDGWEGTIVLPRSMRQVVHRLPGPKRAKVRVAKRMSPRKVAARGHGGNKASALMNAARTAESIMSNPLVQAAMPPGTAAAVRGIGVAAKLAKDGRVQDIATKIVGPGAKRLGKALSSLF